MKLIIIDIYNKGWFFAGFVQTLPSDGRFVFQTTWSKSKDAARQFFETRQMRDWLLLIQKRHPGAVAINIEDKTLIDW